MAKQKIEKAYKTLRFCSIRGFDRNQSRITSLFNTISSTTTNEQIQEDQVTENARNESNETVDQASEELIRESIEESVELNNTIPENSVLANYFEAIQTRLISEGYPTEHEKGAFWIELMMTFFALKTKNSKYFWIPHLLTDNGLEGLRCPKNNCNKKLETKGYNKKPHARRIVDMFRY